MESLIEQNSKVINSASNKALNMLIKLYDLPYFDRKNYEENIKDFQFVLVNEDEEKLFEENQIAMYHSGLNKILVKESMLNEGLLDENELSIILFHELIHMASSNRKRGMIGFNHSALPITYNEGCTQYLAIKMFYEDNIDEGLLNNRLYPQSTLAIKNIVDLLGEEKIYRGFFSADARKEVDAFSPKELDVWIDTIISMDRSYEEEKSKENLNSLKNRIVGFSK